MTLEGVGVNREFTRKVRGEQFEGTAAVTLANDKQKSLARCSDPHFELGLFSAHWNRVTELNAKHR